MPKVPYTRSETLTEVDKEYLAIRSGNNPAIAQLLKMGEVINDLKRIAEKLDKDKGVNDKTYTDIVTD